MLDWDNFRYFLSTARNRALAAVAKDVRVTQSTVGRRLASLEESMDVRLFQHNTDGFVLTLAGGAILAHALKVEGEALSLQRTVQRHATHVEGVVRVVGSQLVTTHFLACCFAELHARSPTIMIELHPIAPEDTSAAKNVDVTVQLRAFGRDELVARRLSSVRRSNCDDARAPSRAIRITYIPSESSLFHSRTLAWCPPRSSSNSRASATISVCSQATKISALLSRDASRARTRRCDIRQAEACVDRQSERDGCGLDGGQRPNVVVSLALVPLLRCRIRREDCVRLAKGTSQHLG